MDKINSDRRSANMRRIRSRDTKPEKAVRKVLSEARVRYRLHRKDLPGHPDLAISRIHLAVFVHGCFWHRHQGCKRAFTPATREQFWKQKLDANVLRDEKTIERLASLGWQSLIVWECDTKDDGRLQRELESVVQAYRGRQKCRVCWNLNPTQPKE